MIIKRIDNNRNITVYGVTFHGFSDLKKYALSGYPKEGIYVGEDSEPYPCFDSSDYAFENRSYWNFVFAKSKEELDEKLDLLKRFKASRNYYKLNSEIYPMVYFGGDNSMPIEVTECNDLVVPDAKHSKKKQKVRPVKTGKTRMELLIERLKGELKE
ncbi:hypothetical protein [Bacteroides sp.]